jgi:hypothetical protein
MELSPLETQVLGQNRWLRGGPAALRVIVSDHLTGRSLPARVTLSLTPLVNGKPGAVQIPLYSGDTNHLGTLEATFIVPHEKPGPYELTVAVSSSLGKDTVKQPIQIEESAQLMLTADKPLYQPGQVMHLRVLALDMATRHALADRPVVLEIEDARGNKVFKKKDALSKFGIASADFQLADEVNMGTYTLRAALPEGQAEKKVRVERYVLPKFKVALTTEKPYYLPGERVNGTVQASYFFGKPVAGGEITVEVNTVDIGVTKLTELKGKTDANGKYTFDYTLPNSFVGQPFEQGKAVVEFHGTLKDTADHKQEARTSVPVVKDPILLVVVPESRQIVPDVPNRVFIAAATPDGAALKNAPVSAGVVAGIRGSQSLKTTTDELGLATFTFTPGKDACTIRVTATDPQGHAAEKTVTLSAAPGQEGLILRVDRPMAKVGDRLNLVALSSVKGGTLYLDVIRNRQTILTHAQPMGGGETRFSLPVTPDMVGTLELHAYKILPNEDIIRDTRTMVVSPADDLKIAISADKGEYRPGGDAVFKFSVRDGQNRPVLAALGLAMVDESVFALSELQPGLEKIVFTLEKELMEPKYEIHGLKPTGLMQPEVPVPLHDESRQRAANMLFSTAPLRGDAANAAEENGGGIGGGPFRRGGFVRGRGFGGEEPGGPRLAADGYFDFRINTYAQRWAQVRQQVIAEMVTAHQKILEALQRYRNDTKTSLTAAESLTVLVDKGYLSKSTLLDRWGNYYKTDLNGAPNYDSYFTLNSAGPDGRWGTVDDILDISVYRYYRNGDMLEERQVRFLGMAGGRAGGGFGGADVAAGLPEPNARPEQFALLAARPLALDASGVEDRQVLRRKGEAVDDRADKKDAGAAGGAEPVRVREYFPETMLWNPALLTDENGRAELRVPMADSITTWRMSVLGNSPSGQLGSATHAVKVFQDFFADIDLPVSLTQNDRMEIPVAVYNYLPQAQEVTLTLKEEPWFTLQGPAKQATKLDAGQVKVVTYPIVVKAVGRHALTVTARGTKLSDALKRAIEVVPDGKEFRTAINDRLEGKIEQTVTLPAKAIKEGNAIWVKLYPGTFSQVVEGLDGILRMPNGCFEQTSSTTYPNILVLDYLKTTKRINPELQMKAEGYINVGYQRLVTFECKSGGFSWFGDEPAHQVLTAYGLLEFGDMAKVHEVDPSLIQRTQAWLAGKQKPDGTWEETNQGIAEGIINRQTGALRTTAYIAWALAESGYQGLQVAKGVDYVKAHRSEAKDPYTLAVLLNLLTVVERDGETTSQVADALIALAKTTDKTAWWQADTKTFTGASQEGADLETTGLAAFGLVKWGRNAGFTNKVLTYLVQGKDSFGTWQSTQGTVWAMKSLLFASRNGVGGGKGTVTVVANGQKAATFKITPDDSDVMRQVSLAEYIREGDNKITLQYDGEGSPLYQIVGRYYLPWKEVEPPLPAFSPLTLSVAYDKTTLAQDDAATVTVTIHNTTDRIAEMPLIDVGVPPGFTVVPDELEAAAAKKTISKYTLAARQVILYLEKLDPGQTVTLTWQVRAKFPIRARTPLSRAYPYYNPERVAVVAPTDMVVTK